MQRRKVTNMCILTMKSITNAIRAKNVLEGRGISVTIVSIDPRLTERGCAYGIRFDCADAERVKGTLDAKGVPYGVLLGGGKHESR